GAYAESVSVLVPGVEILLAGLLIIPRYRLFALMGCFGLMVMFTAYIIIILNFSDYIPCSCGGVLENLSWTQHLIFNIVFIGLAAVAILLASRFLKPDKFRPSFKAMLVVLFIIAAFATLLV